MSRTAKNPGGANSGGTELPFEEALHKLESIVEAMENADLPLETLLARFEEGRRQMSETSSTRPRLNCLSV